MNNRAASGAVFCGRKIKKGVSVETPRILRGFAIQT